MRLESGNPPTDAQLMSPELGHAFAKGFMAGTTMPQIPEEEWAKEIEAMQAEERDWWEGSRTPAQLVVELPFWLMIPSGETTVQYDDTNLSLTVRHDFVEICHGPTFMDSRVNVAHVGPSDGIKHVDLGSVVPDKMPIFRDMKTVVVFEVMAMEDAFLAWEERSSIEPTDRPQVRRINRVMQYFESLAFAHIPFLNNLITSYRSVSLDPYAVEVSEWDVPIWYAQHDSQLVRIGLMPYWDADGFPSVNCNGDRRPYYAATQESLCEQLGSAVAPGKMELLDALSLSYRGRFGDAVRSAVTAIEVVLEAQLEKLLLEKGHSEQTVQERLADTRNSFFDRLRDYERLSGKRIPGPVLSYIPYINGIRLCSELEWVRRLRHKIVHEGTRVDIFARRLMLRAIETMTWLFQWLSSDDAIGEGDSRNYTFFGMLRGDRSYPVNYTSSGVEVVPMAHLNDVESIPTVDELRSQQYADTLAPEHSDSELFSRMSFYALDIECEEAPPQDDNLPILQPRFLLHDKQNQEKKAIVFCMELDGLVDIPTANGVAAGASAYLVENGAEWHTLCVIHHQRHMGVELREVADAIPEDVEAVFKACGITVISAVDLQQLICGAAKYEWDSGDLRALLFTPGRQGICPPAYRRIGVCMRYFPKHSVVSIRLDEGSEVSVADTLTMRLADGYYEEVIDSLQVEHNAVESARGPCRIGVRTALTKSELKNVGEVFVREPPSISEVASEQETI